MKKLPVLVFMMLVVSCLFFSQTKAIAETVAGGAISGKVKDATTQIGLAGVSVYIYDSYRDTLTAIDTTDATGAYTVIGLPAGNYRVKFDGWTSAHGVQWYNNKLNESDADTVTVTVGNTATLADALLSKTGVISGKVRDKLTQTGIAGISVYLYNRYDECDVEAVTDDTGAYVVNGLATGSYKIEFVDDYNNIYAQQWYNNESYEASVDTVVGNITTLDDTLMVVGGKITGKAKDGTNQVGLGNVQVSVFGEYTYHSTMTDHVGAYTVTGLATGSYKVEFSASQYATQYYNNKTDRNAADPVSVTVENTTTLSDTLLVKRGKISGKAKDSATQAGIAGIKVYVYGNGSYSAISSTTTDATGSYTVADLDNGSYKVMFDGGTTGYATQWYNNKPDGSVADAITVTAANTSTLTDALLTAGATITGKVKDNVSQAGIANVSVRVYDSQSGSNVATVTTDAAGSYTVTGLAVRGYKLRFVDGSNSYVPQWYNNKLEMSVADTVAVTAGNTTTLADTLLIEGGKVSGKVKDSKTQAGIAGYSVHVYDPVSGDSANAISDANGNYTVTGLDTGNYIVVFYASGGYLPQYSDTVAVTAGSTTTLNDVFLVMGGRVSGYVKDGATQSGFSYVSVQVYDMQGSWVADADTDDTGAYAVAGLPTGNYKVRYDSMTSEGYAAQWYNNKTKMAAANIVAVEEGNTTSLADVLLNQGGKISGVVTDAATQAGIAGIRVYVYDSQDNQLVTSVLTGDSGEYSTAILASGSYKIKFDRNLTSYVSQWNDQKADIGATDPVVLTAPATTVVNASLAVGGSISGTVTDSSGAPLAGISVNILDSNDIAIYSAVSNVSGNYLAKGVPSGSHKVRFVGNSKGFVNKYYGDTIYPANAQTVLVQAPDQTSGVNASLVLGGSISGTVTDAGGVPLTGVSVQVYDVNSAHVSFTSTFEGNYKLAGIPDGVFKVGFSYGAKYASQWYGAAGSFAAAGEVAVSSGADITGIDVQLGSGRSIYSYGDSRDFGTVLLNSKTVYRTITINNYGTENLVLGAVSLSGINTGEFSVQNDGCSDKNLIPGGNCTFRIFFSPSSVGLKVADITVLSNDPDTPELTIQVKGSGFGTITLPVNGVCGAANNSIFLTPPVTNLCTGGTASAVSGSGPWNWSCNGTNGGTTVNCTANIQTYPLTLSFAGTGGGSVSGDVSCTSGTSCPLVAFEVNSPVNLLPLADSLSTFAGWSGTCSNTSGNCTFTMDSAKTVTATFTAAPKVKVGTKWFSTFQSAYNDTATTTGSVIKLLEGTQTENVTITRNISVFLHGGYLATYSGVGTETSIKGKLLLRSGTVRVKGVNIR